MPLSTTLGAFSKNALGVTGGLPYGIGFIGFFNKAVTYYYFLDALTIAPDGTVYVGGVYTIPGDQVTSPINYSTFGKFNGTTSQLEFNYRSPTGTTIFGVTYGSIEVSSSGAVWIIRRQLYYGTFYLQLFDPVTNTVTAQKSMTSNSNRKPTLMIAPNESMYILNEYVINYNGYSEIERMDFTGTTTLRLRIANPISTVNTYTTALFTDIAVDSSNNIYAPIAVENADHVTANEFMFIAKLNSVGTTQWKKRFTYVNYSGVISKIQFTQIKVINNRIFLFANNLYINTFSSAVIIEIDANGNVINAYHFIDSLFGKDIDNINLFSASGGGFYGYADQRALPNNAIGYSIYFEMDSNLNVIWARTIQVDIADRLFKIKNVLKDPLLGDFLAIAIQFSAFNPSINTQQTYVIKIPARNLPGSGVYQITTVNPLPNPTTIKILDLENFVMTKTSVAITTLDEANITIGLNSTVTSVSTTTQTFTNDNGWNVQLI